MLPQGGKSLQCWGHNGTGQVGDGTTIDEPAPVTLSGFPVAPAVALGVSAGNSHTCATTTGQGLWCWGDNVHGDVGDGTTTERDAPVQITDPHIASGVAQLGSGGYFTCGIVTIGATRCWGYNDFGQLGIGNTKDQHLPNTAVTSLPAGLFDVSAGFGFSCGVTISATAYCWGANGNGELGNGTTTDSSVPVAVTGLPAGVVQIAAGGGHACALLTTSAVMCWGYNAAGQLGDGTFTDSSVPVAVSGLSQNVMAISVSRFQSCALVSGAHALDPQFVECWGYNGHGELGDGSTSNANTPQLVQGL